MRLILYIWFTFVSLVMLNACAVQQVKHPETSADWIEFLTETANLMKSEYVDEISTNDLAQGAIEGMKNKIVVHGSLIQPEEYSNIEKHADDPFDAVTDTFQLIQSRYGAKIDSRTLVHSALGGMIKKIDADGMFYIDRSPKGDGAVGLAIAKKNDRIVIQYAIMGSPAERAGILPCDELIDVDGQLVKDFSLFEIIGRLQGNVGTSVTIKIARSEKEPFYLILTREALKIKDISYKIMEDGIAYIRLSVLNENTAKDLESTLRAIYDNKMMGVILDIRNNHGGLFTVAIDISDQFLNKGELIVSRKNRKESKYYHAKNGSPYPKYPLVVLVNKHSASGAEIIAAALQDSNRATIIGERTFGRGSIQSFIPLRDGSNMRLTSSRFFTPRGNSLQGIGIEPDIVIESPLVNDEKESISCIDPQRMGDVNTDLIMKKAVDFLQNK